MDTARVSYLVKINKDGEQIAYTAIGDRDALIDAAYDEHGACGVTLMVQE